jgi:hypothetical protein
MLIYIFVGIIVFLAILIIFGQILSNRINKTPFQNALKNIGNLKNEKVFDIFISYKSENSQIARQIAERLISIGFIPWCAEYIISIDERNDFMHSIDIGLNNSQNALCLTSDDYFISKYCCYELNTLQSLQLDLFAFELMRSNKTINNIKWKQLFQFNDIFQATSLLCNFLKPGLNLTQRSLHEQKVLEFQGLSSKYSLDLGGWELLPRKKRDAGNGDIWGPAYTKWIDSVLIWGHIIIGRQDTKTKRIPSKEGQYDDRHYYEEALQFANVFFKKHLIQKLVGVHLLFLGGWSQVAFTTFFGNAWTRMYSIVIPQAYGKQDIEYTFYFYCREPFKDFCQNAYVMDELVSSLKIL